MECREAFLMPPAIYVANMCLLGAYKLKMALGLFESARGMLATKQQAVALHGHRGLFGSASALQKEFDDTIIGD